MSPDASTRLARADVPGKAPSAPSAVPRRTAARAVALWGVLGVVALFAQAIFRLGGHALEPLAGGTLSTAQGALYAAWAAASLYLEGYRAMQLRFCPRVVARAMHLAAHPTPLRVLIAPAFCMGFFHAAPRTRAVAWGMSLLIVSFVVVLRHVPQPWRGIVDGGVVVALVWGAGALLVQLARAFSGAPLASAELPER